VWYHLIGLYKLSIDKMRIVYGGRCGEVRLAELVRDNVNVIDANPFWPEVVSTTS
jgi:hypothetical protein